MLDANLKPLNLKHNLFPLSVLFLTLTFSALRPHARSDSSASAAKKRKKIRNRNSERVKRGSLQLTPRMFIERWEVYGFNV